MNDGNTRQVSWRATISDGTTLQENSGDYTIIEGERKPFVRLCDNLQASGQFVTSFRLIVEGETINLPRLTPRFGHVVNVSPSYFSLSYILEGDDVLGAGTQKHYVDAAAHYENFSVHCVVSLSDKKSWIEVRDNASLVSTPKAE